MSEILLQVRGLKTWFRTEAGTARAVDGVDFDVFEDEVGESGSGKSVTALSLIQLIPDPPGKIVEGQVIMHGEDLLAGYRVGDYERIRKIRGKKIAMIFQEPMTSLNPVFTIGDQVAEALILHEGLDYAAARERAATMLDLVGIPAARERLDDYPHQYSGGMRQRVMIAMALACQPNLLIADEPTTALDVTIQAQILELMLEMKRKVGRAAILLITHDLAVVAETCQRVLVMYCGRIQEVADVRTIFANPGHPYTRGLLRSLPRPGHKLERLPTIEGMVPSLFALPAGCSFSTRCPERLAHCSEQPPPLIEVAPGHLVRCHLARPCSMATAVPPAAAGDAPSPPANPAGPKP